MARAARRRRMGGLPAEVTSFVGRRHETSEVRRLLSQARLLTLTGPGGVGKTRLALHVAHRLRRTFPDGVWQVDLSSLREAKLVAQTVADGLGIRDESDRPAETVLAEYLVSRSLLLVLDNCEHLLDACADLVGLLLREAPGLRVLATSREPLRARGEYIFDVPPMAVSRPGRRADARDLTRYEAAALLYERAAAAVPGFTADDDDAALLIEIARRLDGLPLALELAAVRLKALSLRQLLDRLDDVFGVLGTATGIRNARQRTLRSMIDWSFDLCSPAEQALWARASVFSGTFDLEAAGAVCGTDGPRGGDVLDLVTGLLDKSVLIREDHPAGVRYRQLDTIRQYGAERLEESGESAELRRRHCAYYRRLARRTHAEWFSPGQLAWFGRLRLEHADIRVALDFCVTEPGRAAAGLEIAEALVPYWHANGSLGEGRRWFDRLLARGGVPRPARVRALLAAAWPTLFRNDVAGAARLLDEARELAGPEGYPVHAAVAAHISGLAALLSGDAPAAVELLQDALDRYRAADAPHGVLVVLFFLSAAVLVGGDTDQATVLAQECVALSESLGDVWIRGWARWTQGIAAWRRGDPGRAAELERDGIAHKRHFNDRMGIGQCVEVLAWIAASEGAHRRAACLLGAVETIWRDTGSSLYRHLAPFHDEVTARLRREMGPEAFEEGRAAGRRLSYDEILATAGGGETDTPATAGEPPDDGTALDLLTPREREVATLIADGLSNREIAARLVVSRRTAEGHVEHILAKLGFTSRTQIAAWLTRQTAARDAGEGRPPSGRPPSG